MAPPSTPTPRPWLPVDTRVVDRRFLAVVAWASAVLLGLWLMASHAGTPGPRGETPAVWPAGTALSPPGGAPRLLVFLHPKCPCSRATMHELGKLAGQGRLDVTFVLVEPSPGAWAAPSALAPVAAALGAGVVEDVGGVEAERFGVRCSGHALAFDAAGRRVFDGGVVALRAHEGENDGIAALRGLARSGRAGDPVRTAVFGCPLRDASACVEGPCPRE